jgi:hypothetical protein
MARKNPRWFCQKLSIEDTKVLNENDIKEEVLSGMSRDLIQQEFFCSFDVGAVGSYYGSYLSEARDENRIGHVPYDDHHLVYTAWDIGIGDSCVVVFFQCVGNQINIIDHIEERGKAVSYYVAEIRARKYSYGKHFMPHDARHRDFATGTTPQEVAEKMGLSIEIVPMVTIEEGIEKVRSILPRIFIDEKKCEYLIKCLLEYRAEYNERDNVYRKKPLHNWASHSADAVRYMAVSIEECSLSNSMDAKKIAELRAANGFSRSGIVTTPKRLFNRN